MKKIIGLSFPENNINLGLEPSILNVLPRGSNVTYSQRNLKFDDSTVEMYLCSVYISGMDEFVEWSKNHDNRKIVVGGYHPTMFPEKFINYANKIIMGPCDDIIQTLNQSDVKFERSYYDNQNQGNNRFAGGKILRTLERNSNYIRLYGEKIDKDNENPSKKSEILIDRIIPGILTFKNLPRLDLYDIGLNQQIIPDKKINDISVSINTSFGCPYKCDFCCTPTMFGNSLISKPIETLEQEIKLIIQKIKNQEKEKYIFIRDENFTLQNDFELRIKLISSIGAKIYLFASANTLTEDVIKKLANNNVYMICLGLEDPTKEYTKNKKLYETIKKLKQYKIYTYLSFIVDPLQIVGEQNGLFFYKKLNKKFIELKPEMVCGNFLMPFPGTPIWDKFYHLISDDDFKFYDSKTPFLIKNKIVAEKMKYFMFKSQLDYFTSKLYNKTVRQFEIGDTLHLRFLELKEKFNEKFEQIKFLRP